LECGVLRVRNREGFSTLLMRPAFAEGERSFLGQISVPSSQGAVLDHFALRTRQLPGKSNCFGFHIPM
jgi:hypothetical protein